MIGLSVYKKSVIATLLLSSMLCTQEVLALGRQDEFKQIKELEESTKEGPSPEIIQRPTLEYKSEDLRDPFQSVFAQEGALPGQAGAGGLAQSGQREPPSISVQGIIWGTTLPQAIINDQVVKIGDMIEGAKIIGIDKAGVNIIFQDMEYTLPVPGAKDLSKKSQGG